MTATIEGRGNGTRIPARQSVAKTLEELSRAIANPGDELTQREWVDIDRRFHRLMNTQGQPHMQPWAEAIVALWLLLFGLATLTGLIWMWPVADALHGTGEVRVMRWFGPDFAATAMTSLLIVVALAAVAGSVVQTITVFTLRAGKRTLERGYEWWYLLRPVSAALLGPLFFLAVQAGLMAFGASGPQNTPDLSVMVTAGALAGLFTDRVLQRLQGLLGATNPSKSASIQAVPHEPAARPSP